ncbi:MAG: hypothetical protein IT236_18450 [Bacteroidia bacterium]|nr:hypothetical protein [Bacteroidia bacterium]
MTKRIAKIGCLFLLSGWLSSCITNGQLIKQAYKPKGLITGINTLNATYKNQTDSANGINLWAALRYCKTFKNDTLKIPRNALVHLEYDGKRYLQAKLFDGSKLLDTLVIKARSKHGYLLLKRHLFLVPIPFIFYYYH